MMDMKSDSSDLVEFTTTIVSAYVSNNTVIAGDLPSIINDVHDALARASLHATQPPSEELQVTEAPSSHALQHVARGIPREVGPAAGLSDGGAELCRGPLRAGEEDGSRPAP
jgi:ROS/MUCR transcriptional regulator protein